MSLLTVSTVSELREFVQHAKFKGLSVGFVPTMGNLHAGHMSLIKQAKKHCDLVVASIFVNPLQFNDKSDLTNYPRTLEQDQALLTENSCNLLFAPTVDEMYPNGQESQTIVSVPDVSMGLCGGSRPGHFDGVATVVTKLLNMAQADKAFFGEKDFQQLAVIRKMVADLCIPVDIVGVSTERNSDGLALSSRNGYLSTEELALAPALYKALQEVATAVQQGNDFVTTLEQTQQRLNKQGFKVDYLSLCRVSDLKPATADDDQLVVLIAAFLGSARLIDNLPFPLNRTSD
ncbi:MAG: pantoate--beta-alanine ligase [Oleispira sp.]|jgi:pantoate--beta-alanine ligase|tara:strand:- start:55 stop:921 length:867 start_codon:yes stop_codon:yes gene_type:complete